MTFILLGVLAAVACLVGMGITVFVLCKHSGRGNARTTSQSEYPLNDQEKGVISKELPPPEYTVE